MKLSRILLLAGAITGLNILLIQALPIVIQGQATQAQDAMKAQMMKYGTPGKPHEFLKRFAGDWDVAIAATPTADAQPQKSRGTMKSELIFGGRFLRSDFDGLMGQSPAQGLQLNGYDMFQNVYTTIWLDSWSTGYLALKGTLDATGNVLTSTGESPDPMTDGKTMDKLKTVVAFTGEGKYTFTLYMIRSGGPETKTLEMIFTRKR